MFPAMIRVPAIDRPKRRRAVFAAFCFAVAAAAAGGAQAASFQDCLAGLRPAVVAAGVDAATFDKATSGLQPDPQIFALAQAQPEFKTPIWDYLAGLVDEERVNDGRAMMARWRQALATAQARYGVDEATMTAIWGVESDFGRSFGTRPIMQSLATLSCGPYRAAYFRSEFIAALKILQHGDIAPEQFAGSWAGAFGHTQFMPSTFLRTAVDLDGDGRKDLINSVPDALGSTANYLRKAGWAPGVEWGFEVRLPPHYAGPSGRTRKEPMAAWAARGITQDRRPSCRAAPARACCCPPARTAPAFLVTHNFDAIYSYNAAESYALAIALLSDRLRGRPGLADALADQRSRPFPRRPARIADAADAARL